MRPYHCLFECICEGQAQDEAGYDLRCQNLEHRDIINGVCIIEHKDERNKQGVCDYWRKCCQNRLSFQKISADCTYERCERAKNHIEHSEWREKEVCEKTTYRKTGDGFREYDGQKHKNFRYAKLYRSKGYCAEGNGQGKV